MESKEGIEYAEKFAAVCFNKLEREFYKILLPEPQLHTEDHILESMFLGVSYFQSAIKDYMVELDWTFFNIHLENHVEEYFNRKNIGKRTGWEFNRLSFARYRENEETIENFIKSDSDEKWPVHEYARLVSSPLNVGIGTNFYQPLETMKNMKKLIGLYIAQIDIFLKSNFYNTLS